MAPATRHLETVTPGTALDQLLSVVFGLETTGGPIPRATSAIRIFQQLGGAFGGAVLAVVVQRQLAGKGAAAGLAPVVQAAAFASTFWWVLGFIHLAALPALLLPAAARGPRRRGLIVVAGG
ncbi:hypothetical protein JNW89_22005, partial [Micromonospora sp. 4G55]|nr:hypothetical protein [Micromonospora sp. 4G55]